MPTTTMYVFAAIHHRLNGSSSPVLMATHHSYGSLAWLSDVFLVPWELG